MVYMVIMGIYSRELVSFDNQMSDLIATMFTHWRKYQSVQLDEKSIEILSYFTKHQQGSTYQCFKYMNDG
jgi:hypothetical protein